VDLTELVDPARTAVLVSEMQRGIAGDLADGILAPLRAAVAGHRVVEALAGLLADARRAGVPVVHATLQYPADRAGVTVNTPLLAVSLRDPGHLRAGSAQAAVIPALGPAPGDLVHARTHGVSPFTGTDLDTVLRDRGVDTLVVGGVSLNEAIIGGCIEAVNLGYRVAVVADGALGVPYEFGLDMLRYAFRALGTVTTTAEVRAAWQR
jgi:biuret amidohydrolase